MSREELIRSIIEELAQQDLSGPEWDDYDENGVAYWEKWEKMECECGKLKCPNCSEVGK